MGSHGWSTAEHTSLTEKMIRESPIPVLTVGNGEGEPPTLFGSEESRRPRILATVDDENHSDVGVDYAAALTDQIDARLELLEVFPEGSDKGKSADRMSRAEEKMRSLAGDSLGDRVESRAVAGDQVEAILREVEARGIDLVVRPVHSGLLPKAKRRQYADLELLHSSPCPVVFVPAKFTL
jgi:nucleotide-binding universal stress UspA family protein